MRIITVVLGAVALAFILMGCAFWAISVPDTLTGMPDRGSILASTLALFVGLLCGGAWTFLPIPAHVVPISLPRGWAAVVLALVLVGASACQGSPAAPTPQWKPAYVPLHHNIPATFEGHADGPVIYLCATQPRTYLRPLPGSTFDSHTIQEMETTTEEDHYLSYQQCPAVPID